MHNLILKAICLILILFTINGCSTTNYDNHDIIQIQINDDKNNCLNKSYNEGGFDIRLHQIYIDKRGYLVDPYCRNLITDDDTEKNKDKYVDNILANFSKQDKKTLTIFIHGGLNTFNGANRKIKKVAEKMLEDGTYPLFISWDAGGPSNYIDHLTRLRSGKRVSPVSGIISAPFVLLEDVLRSIATFPASTYHTLTDKSGWFQERFSQEKINAKNAVEVLRRDGTFNINDNSNNEKAKEEQLITRLNPVKLISSPFIDAMGKGTWDSLLRRTDLVLSNPTEGSADEKNGYDTAVIKFLDKFSTKFPQHSINLIGHSMGTIVANSILLRYPNMKFQNIIYMAAACSLKDLEHAVNPYLNRNINKDTKFYNLSLHPYRDIRENHFYDFVPRGSLLVWIDQKFGYINSFKDRTAGFWYNIATYANDIFKNDMSEKNRTEEVDIRKNVYLTKFDLNSGPMKHGDFDEYKFWDKHFWEGIPIKIE